MPGLLEQRNEVARLHDAALGVAPAQQRLHALRVHLVQVERRLVGEEELVVGERLAQVRSRARMLRLLDVLHARLERSRSGPCRPTWRGTSRCRRRAADPRRSRACRWRCRCSPSRSTVAVAGVKGLFDRFQQPLGDQLWSGRERRGRRRSPRTRRRRRAPARRSRAARRRAGA